MAYTEPHDLEAEKAIVGAILVSPKALGKVLEEVRPEDFYSSANRAILRAAFTLAEKNEPVDHVTLVRELENDPAADGLKSYLLGILDSFPNAANVTRYAQIVRSLAFRRELMGLSARAEKAASESEEGGVKAVEELHRAATRTRADEDVYTFATGADDFERRVVMRMQGQNVMGIPTGISKLDRATTGWHDGDLVIIAARPGMAKTVFLWQGAITAARHGYKAFAMNLEMAYGKIQERCACATGSVSYESWRRGDFSEEEGDALLMSYAALSELPIFMHNPRAGRTVEDLRRAVRGLKPDIVFVDYLQLLATEKANRGDRYTTVTLVSNDLKQLAVEENIPVVCAAQLSRKVEERFDKRPVMSDLRESGYIEQDADVLLMMYRDAYYYPEGEREGKHGPEPVPNFHPQKVEFIARKDREGGNWATDSYFLGEAMWLEDHPHQIAGRAS